MLFRLAIPIAIVVTGCHQPCASQGNNSMINTGGDKIASRFVASQGYKRTLVDGFGSYLRELPLQPHGSGVHLYNGKLKNRQDVHAAVIKMDVGKQDLQQCADAVIRLKAEYLYHSKQFDKIYFNFTNGFRADYDRWRQGYRIVVKGNNVSWVKNATATTSYSSFLQYMNVVFSYAGTLSLSKELKPVTFKEMQPGDVLIQGGSPGHAVIVVDMVIDKQGNKLFMLAQSYMPAQEIHILVNPGNREISPWYNIKEIRYEVQTPEWDFTIHDLKRFE